jgi:hypothetical protein
LSLCRECLSGGFHGERVVQVPRVAERDPVTDCVHHTPDAVEALAKGATLLKRSDHALDHAILLRAVRRDELMLEAAAANQGRMFSAGEDQLVIGLRQMLRRRFAEGTAWMRWRMPVERLRTWQPLISKMRGPGRLVSDVPLRNSSSGWP